jgi:hypothetical protein
MNAGKRGIALFLLMLAYPAFAYWVIYVPLIVPSLKRWHSIPLIIAVPLIGGYVVLIAVNGEASRWRGVIAKGAAGSAALLLLQWHAGRLGAPAFSHPDLDLPVIWAIRSLSVALAFWSVMALGKWARPTEAVRRILEHVR